MAIWDSASLRARYGTSILIKALSCLPFEIFDNLDNERSLYETMKWMMFSVSLMAHSLYVSPVGCFYNLVQYNMILHTAQLSKRTINPGLNSQNTFHISPQLAMFCVSKVAHLGFISHSGVAESSSHFPSDTYMCGKSLCLIYGSRGHKRYSHRQAHWVTVLKRDVLFSQEKHLAYIYVYIYVYMYVYICMCVCA